MFGRGSRASQASQGQGFQAFSGSVGDRSCLGPPEPPRSVGKELTEKVALPLPKMALASSPRRNNNTLVQSILSSIIMLPESSTAYMSYDYPDALRLCLVVLYKNAISICTVYARNAMPRQVVAGFFAHRELPKPLK